MNKRGARSLEWSLITGTLRCPSAFLPAEPFLMALVAGAGVRASGLRLPERSEPGLDPNFARGWLAPEFDRFGSSRTSGRTPTASRRRNA